MASKGTVEEHTHETRLENRALSYALHAADKSNVIEIPSDQEPNDQVENDPSCVPVHSLRFEVCFDIHTP